jgi:hypothetical protein
MRRKKKKTKKKKKKKKILCHIQTLPRCYHHLVWVEGLVSSSNPESYAGGSIATNRVSQAGQVKRVETRRREIPRIRKL